LYGEQSAVKIAAVYHRYHHHPSSLRIASHCLSTGKIKKIDAQTKPLFREMAASPVSKCSPECSLYDSRKHICPLVGDVPSFGEACQAQSVSREAEQGS
jgi:hypothetical protein